MELARGEGSPGDHQLEISGIETKKTTKRALQELAVRFKKQITTNIKQA
jgi:hypothetical protein